MSLTPPNLVTITPTASARMVDLAEVAIHLHPDDEVAVARVPLPPGLRLRDAVRRWYGWRGWCRPATR